MKNIRTNEHLFGFIEQIQKDLKKLERVKKQERNIINTNTYKCIYQILDGLFSDIRDPKSDVFYSQINFLSTNPASQAIIETYGKRTWKKILHVASTRYQLGDFDYACDLQLTELVSKLKGKRDVFVQLLDVKGPVNITEYLGSNVNELFDAKLGGYNYITSLQHQHIKDGVGGLLKYGRTSNISERSDDHLDSAFYTGTLYVKQATQNEVAGEAKIRSWLEEQFLIHYDERPKGKKKEVFYNTTRSQKLIQCMAEGLDLPYFSTEDYRNNVMTIVDNVLKTELAARVRTSLRADSNRKLLLFVNELITITGIIYENIAHDYKDLDVEFFLFLDPSVLKDFCENFIGMEGYNANEKAERLRELQKLMYDRLKASAEEL